MIEEPRNRLYLRIVCKDDIGVETTAFERKSVNRLTSDQILLMIPKFSADLKKWVSEEVSNRIEFLNAPNRQSEFSDFREDGHTVDEPECFTLLNPEPDALNPAPEVQDDESKV